MIATGARMEDPLNPIPSLKLSAPPLSAACCLSLICSNHVHCSSLSCFWPLPVFLHSVRHIATIQCLLQACGSRQPFAQKSVRELTSLLRTHRVNTLTELCRIECITTVCNSEDEFQSFQDAMTAAWKFYVSSNQMLSELRGLSRNYPFCGDIVTEARTLVRNDPKSDRSWNLAWLCLVKIRDEYAPDRTLQSQYRLLMPTQTRGLYICMPCPRRASLLCGVGGNLRARKRIGSSSALWRSGSPHWISCYNTGETALPLGPKHACSGISLLSLLTIGGKGY